MRIENLSTLAYRQAWDLQKQAHAQVLAGGEERIILLEHRPVITFGRRGNVGGHLRGSAEHLARLGVELVESDRGGDITFHGPGQLVAYPILRLADHGLSVSGFVHGLERAVIKTVANWGVCAQTDPTAIGVWAPGADSVLAKLCAIGVRISRGVSLHGLALNVTTDLRYFNLIVPCGLAGRPVTSLADLLGDRVPEMASVKATLGQRLVAELSGSTR